MTLRQFVLATLAFVCGFGFGLLFAALWDAWRERKRKIDPVLMPTDVKCEPPRRGLAQALFDQPGINAPHSPYAPKPKPKPPNSLPMRADRDKLVGVFLQAKLTPRDRVEKWIPDNPGAGAEPTTASHHVETSRALDVDADGRTGSSTLPTGATAPAPEPEPARSGRDLLPEITWSKQ